METSKIVRQSDNYNLYWGNEKKYEQKEPKEKGSVRDMSERIKAMRIAAAKQALKRIESIKKRREYKEKLKAIDEQKDSILADKIYDIMASKASKRKIDEPAVVKRNTNGNMSRKKAYLEKRASLEIIYGLITAGTYAEVHGIHRTTATVHMLQKRVDSLKIGNIHFIFAYKFTDEQKQELRERLSGYCSEPELRKKYGVRKCDIYTSDGLERYGAIIIDDHLYFKRPSN